MRLLFCLAACVLIIGGGVGWLLFGGRREPAAASQEAWRERLADAMAKRVSFDFVDTPLSDVIAFLGSLCDITIILDPEAVKDEMPAITLRVADTPLKTALRQALNKARLAAPLLPSGKPVKTALRKALDEVGMTYLVYDGAILVTTPERADEEWLRRPNRDTFPPPPARALAEKLAKPICFDFIETPLLDVAAFISSLVDLTIVVDPALATGTMPTVTLRVNDIATGMALRWVCRVSGLAYAWRDDALFLAAPDRAREERLRGEDRDRFPPPPTRELADKLARKVWFDSVETPLREVAGFLSSATALTVVVDPAMEGGTAPTVTLRVSDMAAGSALRWICRACGAAYVWRGETLVFTCFTPGGGGTP